MKEDSLLKLLDETLHLKLAELKDAKERFGRQIEALPVAEKEELLLRIEEQQAIRLASLKARLRDEVALLSNAVAKSMPRPDNWMNRLGSFLFFFSRAGRRVTEECVADYRHEMVEAEAKGWSKRQKLLLHVRHWGGFAICVIDRLRTGIVGWIITTLKESLF